MTGLAVVRSDRLPEGTRYRDAGCRGVVGCDVRLDGDGGLNCPLPLCKEDYPDAYAAVIKRARNERIVARRRSGETVDVIAVAVGLSTRTIHRVVSGRV